MTKLSTFSVGELAAFVQEHLRRSSIDAILSGGAAVSVYSRGLYVSKDIDLITHKDRKAIKAVMQKIGFEEKDRYFTHPDTEYLIEFPAGPLAIAKEPVNEINELKLSTGLLKVITATDCVKDRLSAFYFWDDRQALNQAILVAKEQPVDLDEIKRWSAEEGQSKKHSQFTQQLAN